MQIPYYGSSERKNYSINHFLCDGKNETGSIARDGAKENSIRIIASSRSCICKGSKILFDKKEWLVTKCNENTSTHIDAIATVCNGNVKFLSHHANVVEESGVLSHYIGEEQNNAALDLYASTLWLTLQSNIHTNILQRGTFLILGGKTGQRYYSIVGVDDDYTNSKYGTLLFQLEEVDKPAGAFEDVADTRCATESIDESMEILQEDGGGYL